LNSVLIRARGIVHILASQLQPTARSLSLVRVLLV